MFGDKASRLKCPVDAETRKWLDDRWAWLVEEFGTSRLKLTPVVLANPEFFPDPYDQSEAAARVMLDRVCRYMSLDPKTVQMSFYSEERSPYESGSRDGTSGLYHAEGEQFRIWIESRNLKDPLNMAATMAHELGHVHLLGHQRISPETEDHERLTDLLTVYFGLGVLKANSVIRESNFSAGNYSEWQVSRQGYLSMPMYGYALAKFTLARGEDKPKWRSQLRPDVRVAFDTSLRLLQAPGDRPSAPACNKDDEESSFGQSKSDNETDADNVDARAALSADDLLTRLADGITSFRCVDLPKAKLRGVKLSGCDFSEADFRGADLTGADLSDCNLREADLHGAILRKANLHGADLRDVAFGNADLTGADLTLADIRGAVFSRACLDRTVLNETKRDRSTNLSGVELANVICNADLNAEKLDGKDLFDQIDAVYQPISRLLGLAVFAVIGGFGGIVGGAISNALFGNRFSDDLLLASGVLGAIILVTAGMIWRIRAKPS